MNSVALIDYGSGNVHSAAGALNEAARRAGLAIDIAITDDPAAIAAAARILLPGVGHYADCAANLRARPGLVAALESAVLTRKIPFLGICVGMQLLADTGREDGDTPGLGWIPGIVDRIAPGPGLRVPHVGWNSLAIARPHALLAGLGPGRHRRHHGLWRPLHQRGRARQYLRHPVPPRNEPARRPATARQLPAMDS